MKHVGAVVVLCATAIFGMAFVHPFGNPRVEPARGLGTLLQGSNMSKNAKEVLIAKCADCHSNETRWPIYSRIAPGSWLIERDIIEARKKMNLSIWEQMSADAQDVMIGKIIEEARRGDMPPVQYLAIHWRAKLTSADIAALAVAGQRGESETGSLSLGDPARGKVIFEKRCTGCHAMDVDREGPRLAGVFGRKAGTVPGFDYSNGLKNSGLTWDEATLEKWLTDPDLMVPDTTMDFLIPKAQERSDVIAYLKQ